MIKSCRCGVIYPWTKPPIFCIYCRTFTHEVYVRYRGLYKGHDNAPPAFDTMLTQAKN